MTKKLTISLVGLIFFAHGLTHAQKSTVDVQVTGFELKKSSKIFVSVFSKEGFLEKPIKTKSILASDKNVRIGFELPPGEYAISTYHDINNNGKLDRRFYGKPKEPYGFSQNVKPFGKPRFDACKFLLDKSPKRISIELIN